MMNYRDIENKWQAEWAKARIFEGDIGTKPPYMVTAAFPYANAPQHIGHLRAFGTADVLARYKRMRGFNVLYPMAFHATGTPILAFAKRLQNKDKDLIHELKLFHVPDEEIAKMIEPVYIAEYFIKEIEKGMHAVGYSIDWRRSFISIEPPQPLERHVIKRCMCRNAHDYTRAYTLLYEETRQHLHHCTC